MMIMASRKPFKSSSSLLLGPHRTFVCQWAACRTDQSSEFELPRFVGWTYCVKDNVVETRQCMDPEECRQKRNEK